MNLWQYFTGFSGVAGIGYTRKSDMFRRGRTLTARSGATVLAPRIHKAN